MTDDILQDVLDRAPDLTELLKDAPSLQELTESYPSLDDLLAEITEKHNERS